MVVDAILIVEAYGDVEKFLSRHRRTEWRGKDPRTGSATFGENRSSRRLVIGVPIALGPGQEETP